MRSDSVGAPSLRRTMEQSGGPGAYSMTPLRLYFLMSHEAAALLSYLWNVCRMCCADERNDGWFYCTTKRIAADINMNKDLQARLLRELTGANGGTAWIKTQRRGVPALRYVWIDFELIAAHMNGITLSDETGQEHPRDERTADPVVEKQRQLVDKKSRPLDASCRETSTTTCRSLSSSSCRETSTTITYPEEQPENKKDNKKNNPSLAARRERVCDDSQRRSDQTHSCDALRPAPAADKKKRLVKPPSGGLLGATKADDSPSKRRCASDEAEAADRAKYLLEWLTKKRKVMRSADSVTWCKEFQRLRADMPEEGVKADDRLDDVLEWYVDHLGEDYVPQAYSARSFRQKFLQIEAAMARHHRKTGETPASRGGAVWDASNERL